MTAPILKLSGKDEGISVTVESILSGADSPEKVYNCIINIFPDFKMDSEITHPELGGAENQTLKDHDLSIRGFLMLLHKQQILDTALDSMSRNLSSDNTEFEILRQAAISGKISFNIPGEKPLGGLITIRLEGNNLKDWIEAATWHKGRDSIPRSVNDELSMDHLGEATTWI